MKGLLDEELKHSLMSLATLKVEENIISLELVGAWNTVSGLGLGTSAKFPSRSRAPASTLSKNKAACILVC